MKDAIAEDFLLSSYDYVLPESQIAQFPARERGGSRLMVLDRDGGAPVHAMFSQLAELLPENSLLVANNTKVQPARLTGLRPGGGKAEFLLLTPVALVQARKAADSVNRAEVDGLIRPAAKIRIGDCLRFAHGIRAEILQKGGFGQCRALFVWEGELAQVLAEAGSLPLPPYIKRQIVEEDASRYQTVYSKNAGSVAAPTAGLHFTASIVDELAKHGHEWVELTLHVGYGTFSPVRCGDIRLHAMHSEYVDLPQRTAEAIRRAQSQKRPIVAVGTTSLRAMEGVAAQTGAIGSYAGFINIFIYPGFNFRVANGLITNFHLPCSTLLMLVSALTGRKRVLAAYADAVRAGYRFFSYGDAMLIANRHRNLQKQNEVC